MIPPIPRLSAFPFRSNSPTGEPIIPSHIRDSEGAMRVNPEWETAAYEAPIELIYNANVLTKLIPEPPIPTTPPLRYKLVDGEWVPCGTLDAGIVGVGNPYTGEVSVLALYENEKHGHAVFPHGMGETK